MSASPPEMVDWIDEADRTLGSLPRAEIRRRNLLHRVTATFVFHPDGRVFVHQRSPEKDVYPALCDPCVGGTVVSGESYTANACRELDEELGVHGVPLYALFGHRFSDDVSCSLIRVFACVHPGPFTFQPEEVVGGRWHDEDGLEALIAAGRVCPDSTQGWRTYLQQHGHGRNFARDVAPALTPLDCAAVLAEA